MLSDQRNAYIREILADLKAARMLDAGTVLLIQGALAEQERLAAFVARLRHPEEFGWAVTQEVRDAARAALLGPQPAGIDAAAVKKESANPVFPPTPKAKAKKKPAAE